MASHFEPLVLLGCVVLLFGIVLATEIGRRVGVRRLRDDREGALEGTGAVEAGVFGLLGLLVAFTFSGAAERFDARRDLIVEETNAIDVAYRRLDLLPASAQPALQDLVREYVDSRIEIYRQLPDLKAAHAEMAHSEELQQDIWRGAVAAGRMQGVPASADIVLLPALNHMIDVTTKRTMVTLMHPPRVIYVMLYTFALIGSLLAGYAMAARRKRSWLHILGFAATTAGAVFVIINMEYPRLGLIRLENFDSALVDLRDKMR